ncbi:hypothetical protein ACH3XW_49800 [Acanthocheilonema viteae]
MVARVNGTGYGGAKTRPVWTRARVRPVWTRARVRPVWTRARARFVLTRAKARPVWRMQRRDLCDCARKRDLY